MLTWVGVLKKRDLGSGGWVLRTAGESLELLGEVPEGLDGVEVTVRGRRVRGNSMLMTGGGVIAVDAVERR